MCHENILSSAAGTIFYSEIHTLNPIRTPVAAPAGVFLFPTIMEEVSVTISNGRGKYGKQYAYIRPGKPCVNRSRRVEVNEVEKWIRIIFPEVHYWRIGGLVIGARDEDQAWREYWRVCERSQIRKKEVEISKLEP